jgi:hypothetical protein
MEKRWNYVYGIIILNTHLEDLRLPNRWTTEEDMPRNAINMNICVCVYIYIYNATNHNRVPSLQGLPLKKKKTLKTVSRPARGNKQDMVELRQGKGTHGPAL